MHPYNKAWEFKCDSSIISVAGTPNLSSVVAGTVGKSLYLLNAEGQSVWHTPKTVDNEIWATSISDDGQLIAIGTANKKPLDGTLYVFSRSGNQIWSYRVRSPIWNVKLSDDGRMLIATTWSNQLLLFKKSNVGYDEIKTILIPGNAGLYGCEFIEKHGQCVVASYDKGLYFINYEGAIISEIILEEGLYNISYADDADKIFVALRDGSFGGIDFINKTYTQKISKISQRPICGISTTKNGTLVASGSFDSRVIISNNLGDVIWDFRTKGEVWSTVISSSGSKVVVGCGDHILRVFNNKCTTDAYQEILAVEQSIENSEAFVDEIIFQTLLDLYKKYCVTQYGYSRLKKIFEEKPFLRIYSDKLKDLLLSATLSSSDDSVAHFNLGLVLSEEKNYDNAIKHFQISAANPTLRSLAHRKASECFRELGLKTASTSADRQSHEQHLDYEARHVLFMLARSYEDSGQWNKASKLYEMLLAWDVEFRNARDKLKISQTYQFGSTREDLIINKDYTGSTTSLLGHDVPRNVDRKINNVIEARSKEILISQEDVRNVRKITQDLLSDSSYSRGIKRNIAQLNYNQQLFLKYDYGLPEDEMKKFLETLNAYEYFSEAKKLDGIPFSLDIGSATGRYPSLLKRLGFNAYGIDIEETAILYANEKKGKIEEYPKYICGNALELEYDYFLELILFARRHIY